MDNLTKLAIKYGTDKWGKHHYTPVYHDLFKDKRESVKKVLEIGVGEGAGLRMWRDFFPNAMIYGAEIEPTRVFKEDRIEVIRCDQTSPDDLRDLLDVTGEDIDLVVDDGSHKPVDQVFTFSLIAPFLKTKFIYVIEDVADEGIEPAFYDYDSYTEICGKRYDDKLIVIKPNG